MSSAVCVGLSGARWFQQHLHVSSYLKNNNKKYNTHVPSQLNVERRPDTVSKDNCWSHVLSEHAQSGCVVFQSCCETPKLSDTHPKVRAYRGPSVGAELGAK